MLKRLLAGLIMVCKILVLGSLILWAITENEQYLVKLTLSLLAHVIIDN